MITNMLNKKYEFRNKNFRGSRNDVRKYFYGIFKSRASNAKREIPVYNHLSSKL